MLKCKLKRLIDYTVINIYTHNVKIYFVIVWMKEGGRTSR